MKNKKQNDGSGKMNPAFARQQANIDKETPNPIDISNAPDDADHNEHYNEKPTTPPKEE